MPMVGEMSLLTIFQLTFYHLDTTAQAFLSAFLLTNDTLNLAIKGDGSSSPYGSLIPALEGLALTGSIQGIGATVIRHVYVTLGADGEHKSRW